MISNIDDFVKYIPTARGTRYEDIGLFVEEAIIWAKTDLFGNDLIDKLQNRQEAEEIRTLDTIIALKAYITAIPFLDVVQTTNGFAVINSSTQVPASKERVDKLIKWSTDRLYSNVDRLIEIISQNSVLMSEWKKYRRFEYYTELLFWTGAEYGDYCGTYESSFKNESIYSFTELHTRHAEIMAMQSSVLAHYVSQKYINTIIEKKRNLQLADKDLDVYNKLKFALGLLIKKEEFRAKEILKNIVSTMMKDLDSYSDYKTSDEYAAWIAARYQNKQSDSTYFFM